MSNYNTIAEVKAFKDGDGNVYDVSSFTDDEIQAASDEAEDLIERVTNSKFGPFTEVWILDSDNDKALMFPPAIPYPLITVTSVELLNSTGGVEDTLTENTDFINRGHYLFAGPLEPTNLRRIVSGTTIWAAGLRRYKITGSWGMASVPPAIKRILNLLAIETLKPGATDITSSDIRSWKLGDFAIAFRNIGGDRTSKDLTGFQEIDRVLRRYINYSDLVFNHDRYAYLQSSVYAG